MEKLIVKKISVIIPVYNSIGYLEKCLNSVLAQTYKNLEIVCVDDGSIDNSGKLCDEFAKLDGRIIVIHQTNHGESSARNVGLNVVSGDYITFIDCDDFIEEDMYETMLNLGLSSDADVVACGYSMDYPDDIVKMSNKYSVDDCVMDRDKFLEYVYHRDFYKNVTGYIWNKLFKREVLCSKDRRVYFDEDLLLGGDVLFFANAALNANKFIYTDRCFYHYVQRSESGSHSEDENYRMDGLSAYMKTIDACVKGGVACNVVEYIERFLVFWAQVNARYAYKNNNKDVLDKCLEIMKKYRDVYIKLNEGFEDRIEQFLEIEKYTL